MGGLVLDVLLAFLVRLAVKWVRRVRSRKWPVVTAKVTRAYANLDGFAGDVATVSYDYVASGAEYSGAHDVPCLSSSAAKYIANLYPLGKEIQIRYKPDDPSRSVALI